MITKFPNYISSVYDEIVVEQDSDTLTLTYVDPNAQSITLVRELDSTGIARFRLQGVLKSIFPDDVQPHGARSWIDLNLVGGYDLNATSYFCVRRVQQFGEEFEDLSQLEPHVLTNTPLKIYPGYPLDVVIFSSDIYSGEPAGPAYSDDYSLAYN